MSPPDTHTDPSPLAISIHPRHGDAGPSPAATNRAALIRRARLLAWIGLGWHAIEAAISLIAGIAAGSIALIGFGADSVIEAAAGFVVLWLVSRSFSATAERRSQQLIAISFFVLAAYVGVESVRALAVGDHPEVSWVGIGLSAFTVVTMPPLAIAKSRVGEQLGSSAAKSEARQTAICAWLSGALLIGLGTNAAFGWWWADPAAALVVAAAALREGRAAWRGESCCTSAAALTGEDRCRDACCD